MKKWLILLAFGDHLSKHLLIKDNICEYDLYQLFLKVIFKLRLNPSFRLTLSSEYRSSFFVLLLLYDRYLKGYYSLSCYPIVFTQ